MEVVLSVKSVEKNVVENKSRSFILVDMKLVFSLALTQNIQYQPVAYKRPLRQKK
jgi:hypothetical protein